MALSREAAAAVKQSADIVEIIGEKVSLKASGGNFKGLCPFHPEKTPSFTVNPQRGFYHCFGCGAGGSVIDFLMAAEHLSFQEALAKLAGRLNISLGDQPARAPVGGAPAALTESRKFYHDILMSGAKGEPARNYLRARGFEEEEWSSFGIGYAPEGWNNLLGHASSEGYSEDDLIAAGLIKRGPSGRPYDLLRKRVVFPIMVPMGGCVGFGGRVIDPADEPKYLNTPETSFYKKSRVLFGLAEGGTAIRADGSALLVEGYLDVIRMHQHGFYSAVATCGTALTADHLSLLERYAKGVVLVFDGDEAGMKAVLRSAPLFFNRGIEASVITLPDGLDPDDFLVQKGAEAFNDLRRGAVPIMEYLVWNTLKEEGDSLHGKDRAIKLLLPMISNIRQETSRDVAIRYLADLVQIRADRIFGLLSPQSSPNPAAGEPEAPQDDRESHHQRMFMKILLRERQLVTKSRELLQPDELIDPQTRRLYEKILRLPKDDFEQLEPEIMAETFPEVAPMVRSLLLEPSLKSRAVEQCEAALQYEIAAIKEAEKERLFMQLKQVAGTAEEEPALRRYTQIREELRTLKSVPGARRLTWNDAAAELPAT